ncbi:O-antigen ligase family protein [Polaromonas sp.]|uniref:O-antigen ligase family protein n=1 Tax=Polaromonas sp. TaxID=1869339 RepID=UPI003CAF91C0
MKQILQRVSDFAYPAAGWFGLIMVFGVPWSHAFFYIGLVGMLACLLASPTYYRLLITVCQENIALLAILLFAYIAMGLLYTHAPMDLAIHDVKKYRKLLLIPVFLMLYRDSKWAYRLVVAYGCGALVLMMPTLLDGTGLARVLSLDLTRFANPSYNAQSLVYWRNHIVHGFHASMLFAICLLSTLQHRKLAWLFFAGAAICLTNVLFFINGRIALVTLLVVFLLMAISYTPSKSLRFGLITAVLATSVLAYQFSGKIHARVDSVMQETRTYVANPGVMTSGGARLHYWQMSLDIFAKAPVFGGGPGTFRENLVQPDNPLRAQTHKHAHNEYLTLLSQHGLVGLILFLLLVYQVHRQAGQHDPWLRGVVRFGLVIFLINAMTDSSLNNESEGWTFVLLACLANIRPASANTA